jgi:uncharacterized protein (TIGR01244 family)
MSDFRFVTENFAVSPQISLADVSAAAARGFTLIINNRPDGEAPDQPAGARIEQAARVAGLDYLWVPVLGRPTADQARAVRDAVDTASGTVLAYCRSGTRSINTWAMGEAGRTSRDELIRLGAAAGYDLTAVLGR